MEKKNPSAPVNPCYSGTMAVFVVCLRLLNAFFASLRSVVKEAGSHNSHNYAACDHKQPQVHFGTQQHARSQGENIAEIL